ncbi:GDYXXLXY domain-containing protein [Pseudofulvimonas gallinarii]|uniref:Putative membrane-anchored protein n=1 Tax=Pseudofulvimonas gallinarii TaxID=634155 RepID=A0A4S3KVW3_9GAMM|nr:GDYXXLXY domain-containing protein [Pseudofulvimonas gallinarii]TCS93752.1 putative membrane-anchored protein [Pseudofulvimonas gallinarii]THD13276.1 hypothetical protein B1808_09050 [Pseudofulvimonas gallinarii]
MNWRRWTVPGGLALVLAVVNAGIISRERLVREGETVLLELAPVDPRSLMQGDYMALAFALAHEVPSSGDDRHADGYLILQRDAERRATFVRVQPAAQPRAGDELALRYRVRGGRVRLVSNAWFFSEGQAERYQPARWGEMRVGDDGEALLVALRDENLKTL